MSSAKPPIESREDLKKCAAASAELAWSKMTEGQKAIVRIGMIPFDIAQEYDTFPQPMFAVALMNQAEKHGGMIS